MKFFLKAKYKPTGDQPQAIKKLLEGVRSGHRDQTLLGVTGSGKTFTIANLIKSLKRPVLVLAHNKTLVAQLTQEYRSYFPHNAVEYFVSYYDYYQPEAYLPSTDTYIEKESQINEEIDRLRHSATQALLTRKDVVVVASVSAIYNIGSPELYQSFHLDLRLGAKISREDLISKLVSLHFARNQRGALGRGEFRARGAVFEVMPTNQEIIYRLEFESDELRKIIAFNALTRDRLASPDFLTIFPAKHYITEPKKLKFALQEIRKELKERVSELKSQEKLLEAERLQRRTNYDLEMIENVGYTSGIENYSRYFDGRPAGSPPHSLLEFFPKDYLTVIDESHVTIPQIRGMYEGDRARKKTLIEYGFRLPSALDNRPLKFEEFQKKTKQTIYTSATPGRYELNHSRQVVEQIVRPTGLVDPQIILKPISGQINDLAKRIDQRIKAKQRTLVTTLTKKQAEELSDYLKEKNYNVHYLHSDVDTLERIETLTKLRQGKYDIVVGVNLLREGLDLPEVSLVAILDADKEGFLRSETSLVQTIGRAARNVDGQVVLYADTVTGSMRRAISETARRRKRQLAYNRKHKITPQTIRKKIKDITQSLQGARYAQKISKLVEREELGGLGNLEQTIKRKEREMKKAAKDLEFEYATLLRDEIAVLKKMQKKRKK